MRVELNKLFGLSGRISFEELGITQEIEKGVSFSISLRPGFDVIFSVVDIPITKRGTPPEDIYVVNAKLPLGKTDHFPDMLKQLPALRIEIPSVNLGIDWNALSSLDSGDRQQAEQDANTAVERLIPDVLNALTRFYEAYRHAKYEVDSEIGRNLTQAIDATRRMPDWEFRMGLYYRVVDGSNEITSWLSAEKSRAWSLESKKRLRSLMQRHLSEGIDFAKSRLFDAEQALYDGDLPMAVVNAVIAFEAALSDFVRDQWRKQGVSKSRVDEADKDISLSLLLNIELMSLSPGNNKPQGELIGRLNTARRLRNDIVHNKKRDVSYKEAKESVESTRQLLSYLGSL